jgi:FAD/FMN-containing dehydrogenase
VKRKLIRRLGVTLLLLLAAILLLFGKPLGLWLTAWYRDRPAIEELPPGFTDDASRMNFTNVAKMWHAPANLATAEGELRALLKKAHAEGTKVAIAGARHSMGGHTIWPDGILLDMLPLNHLALDEGRQILRAGAGARWSQIVPYLDACGCSVAIMQSNNNFTVGGSLSANCHGWQHDRPPIASTVESLRVMTADGEVVTCSRDNNPQLFSLVLGGYGLFGVILEAELRVVPNERYQPDSAIVPVDEYVTRFRENVSDNHDVGMAYGRLCVTPGDAFLNQAILTVFRKSPAQSGVLPELRRSSFSKLRREVFRAQIGSDEGKEARWKAETLLGDRIGSEFFSRNQLLNEDAEVFQEQNADRTDILHEYFIPYGQFAPFLRRAAQVITQHDGDLLNVTVRNVTTDHDTFLRYADRDMFGFVMLFSQQRTPEGDDRMRPMTQALIDAALECGGRFYLPYRLHATEAQFHEAYPMAPEWIELKRKYDPEGVFQNRFFDRYGRQ